VKVLVACEYSGVVRDAFTAKGHDAWSCDILPTESPGQHIQGDVLAILGDGWDLMIGCPPCTYLSYVATRSWNDKGRVYKRLDALKFFTDLWEAPIEKICLENPKGCASPTIAKYSQIIQPWYWGDPYYKTTCLWLKNLPKLIHYPENSFWGKKTHVVAEPIYISKSGKRVHWEGVVRGGSNRAHVRSRFWGGISRAMADQWG